MKRTLGTMLAAAVLTACGTTPSLPRIDPPGEAPPVAHVPPPEGARAFTLIGDAPSPRTKQAAIYDAQRDRMLVFGGDANDLWAQRLSAPNEGSWQRIEADGEAPPPGEVVMSIDEKTSRLFVFSSKAIDRAWTLPLDGHGGWQVLGFGSAPKIALGFALVADPIGRKLYAYTSGQPEMWELALDGGTAWTRIAGAPQKGGFSCRDTLIHDRAHGALVVLSGGWPRGDVFSLSLAGTPAWTTLNEDQAWFQYGAMMVFDESAGRFLVLDPGEESWIWSFAIDGATAKWTHLPVEKSDHVRRMDASAIYDAGRGRAVLFGGVDFDTQTLRDDSWALSLDEAPTWAQVGTLDRRLPMDYGAGLAEASETGAIVRFGGLLSGLSTSSHRFDGKTGRWSPLGDTPMAITGWSAGAWDPSGQRLVTFGGDNNLQEDRTLALDLASSTWTSIGDGGVRPSSRSHHSMVNDRSGDRMLVFGGMHRDEVGSYAPVGDLWAFSTPGDQWSELEVSGSGPGARQGHAAAFDDAGQRMLVHGGTTMNDVLADTWILELAPSPHWVALAAKGDAPPMLDTQFAVFDPDTRRFFVVGNLSQPLSSSADRVGVWALSMDGEARWQRYCPTGTRPGRVDGALWTERGLFLTAGGSAWIFDASSPTCK